ncbi:MAG: DUF3524 domain-containing protein [Actinobacteria bacterium]|nr:DUF3524 domain-containing protein [Actinomycetota bacterium]
MGARPDAPPWLKPLSTGLRVWALEPYYGGSHRHFLDGFVRASRHRFTIQGLPGRNWKWRMHGGALALARESLAHVREFESPQVLFASDMLDVATYMALARDVVASTPLILYMHENQLTYPLPPGVERDLGYGMKNITSALAADRVVFNSDFHRREFLTAVEALFEAVPDAPPAWVLEQLVIRSEVLHVGCDLRSLDESREAETGRWGDPSAGPLILWNQRWEYDKAPGDFFRALFTLQQEGVAFRVAVAGSNHGLPTAEFVEARRRLGERVVQWGRVESRREYASLLWAADVVVSTALHEFFGVSIVEAVYCGCRPVLPDRLSYPELLPRDAHARALYPEGGLVSALREAVRDAADSAGGPGMPPWSLDWQRSWVARYDWSGLVSRYDAMVEECWERGAKGEGCKG